jgi:hypothetical protein
MIRINLDKAKAISHDIRRELRSKEFSPLDEIIAKQIPGSAVEEVEAKRQAIRDKYSLIQDEIESAVSADDLLVIVNSMKS